MTGVHILRRTYAHVLVDEPAWRLSELRGDVARIYGLDSPQEAHGDAQMMTGPATARAHHAENPAQGGVHGWMGDTGLESHSA